MCNITAQLIKPSLDGVYQISKLATSPANKLSTRLFCMFTEIQVIIRKIILYYIGQFQKIYRKTIIRRKGNHQESGTWARDNNQKAALFATYLRTNISRGYDLDTGDILKQLPKNEIIKNGRCNYDTKTQQNCKRS